MRSIPSRLWVLALGSALLQALPFPLAGPVPAWRRTICWFCIAPLLACLLQRAKTLSVKQGTLLGYGCGVLWYILNCYWIYATMHRYGGLPELAAAGVLLLFSLYLGLYLALFAACLTYLRNKLGRELALFASPFLWTAVELLRARITGFPWDLLGYTQVDNLWLTRLAPLTGTLGLSLLIAAVNALWLVQPGFLSHQPRWRKWMGPSLALLLTAGLSALSASYSGFPETAGKTAVLMQDNLSVGEDRGPYLESKSTLLDSFTRWSLHPLRGPKASAAPLTSPPEIIAWAEAPTNFFSADPAFRQAASLLAQTAHAPLVADAASAELPPTPSARPQEFVSAAFFSADGDYVGRYDKMHLVPFGEYVPYKPLFFFAGHLLDGLDFSPGTGRRTLQTGGHNFGVFICYESVFGDEVRQFVQNGAQVFVNLSDDGWYGDTSAPWEHLDMVRMRAIENRRWVLRATNTGVTGSIDPQGRLVASLPRHIRGALAVPFAYRDGTTFYTRHGDWIGWICLGLSAALLGLALLRQPAVKRSPPLPPITATMPAR